VDGANLLVNVRPDCSLNLQTFNESEAVARETIAIQIGCFLTRGLGFKVKGRVEKQDCNEQ
jgi:hypothetical protein